ncbi:MAG: Segregation and condensation protein A [Parcubacteria group bacterium GW2011_GWC1_45_9]|nr:MAG: Segregation and condensation protein A [Parcubacteria group bacterium GW2011_GWA1_Parcubacteria_45_10]KKT88604.1 MAG: Segregation and condensation protein A [Parcubacteria group bacterium GW2011_GWB1_45_10]KKU17044.1 MAG: Segregation and condensation protein A [Parcubacteria group bacterium GW2011_GWC1_45_9]HCI05229.1 hypothetical protein [Patescibacteria group bacterium]
MKIKIEKFEGPLDLLLELIEQQKLDICEVALAEVTDQYLEIISQQEFSPNELADFLVVASRLLLIKSKTLLPMLDLTEEEEAEIKDLENAMQEYRRYKNQAKIVKEILANKSRIFTRELWQGREPVFSPPKRLDLESLVEAFKKLSLSLEKFLLPKVSGYLERVVSVEERIKEIILKIESRAVLSFNTLAGGSMKKIDVIINFLAVLFLFREKNIMLSQAKDFGEIKIMKLHQP